MRRFVEDALRKCNTCRKIKHKQYRPYGLKKSPKTPTGAWTSVALDFIVKLPLSREPITKVIYNSILVITDRLTKYGYFILYKEASSAEDLAYTFYKYVVANHGMPEEIISNRDKLFTSKFWKLLMDLVGTRQNLSTLYYPQTDGQTEQLNQTLEQYLRWYVNYWQNDLVQLLPVSQLAYNSAITETTSVSPFYANYGYHPVTTWESRRFAEIAQKVSIKVEQMQTLHDEL